MNKLNLHTANKADDNFIKLAELFPNAVTETIVDDVVTRAIDKDVLMQEISAYVVEGNEERYQFTWPDKKKSVLLANAPNYKTLRPCPDESVNFDTTENIYIEGDNLDVLKLLQETYLSKVKMIYIDPPYNTGKDFVYSDKFAVSSEEWGELSGDLDEDGNRMFQNTETNGRYHTDWLNMIYPRLRLAKDLLKDDGVIFISIDDNEVENLKKICNEIFGAWNFLAQIIHKNNSMKNQSKYVGVSTEYVLIFTKSMQHLKQYQPYWRANKKGATDINNMFNKLIKQGLQVEEIREELTEMYSRPKYSHLSRWNKVDEKGVFTDKDLSRDNGHKDFTIINPSTGKLCLVPNRGWGKKQDELLKLQKLNLIWYGDEKTPPREKAYITEDTESVFDNFIFADTSTDKKMLKTMFDASVFEFPKSLDMLKQLISLCTTKDDIILDFFSGSATTAHAVMQLNAEDGGNRKFIMVQLPEVIDEKHEAYKAGYRTICDIGKERIRRAGAKIKDEKGLVAQSLDTGFRVLKCDSTNMKDVYYYPTDVDQEQIGMFISNIKEDRAPEDLLFQVMLDLGVFLSCKIEKETVDGKNIFVVYQGDIVYLIACFDQKVSSEVVTAIAKRKPYYAVFRDSSMANDSLMTSFEQIFESYSKDTVRKVL